MLHTMKFQFCVLGFNVFTALRSSSISLNLSIIRPVLSFNQFAFPQIYFPPPPPKKNRTSFSWQTFTSVYIYSVLICEIQGTICTVTLICKVHLYKIDISIYMKTSEHCMNELTHIHACYYVWIGAAIYSTIKFVAAAIYTKLSIIYKHSEPLN